MQRSFRPLNAYRRAEGAHIALATRNFADFPIPPKHKGIIHIPDEKSRQQLAALAHNANPWTRVMDPNGSGDAYWWNQRTNETTALGAPKPAIWLKQLDPNGSGQAYW